MRSPIALLAPIVLFPQLALAAVEVDAPVASGPSEADESRVESPPTLVHVGAGLGVLGSTSVGALVLGFGARAVQAQCPDGFPCHGGRSGDRLHAAIETGARGAAVRGRRDERTEDGRAGVVLPNMLAFGHDKGASVGLEPTGGALSPLPADMLGSRSNMSAGLALTFTHR